jgi:hypothetical protein
VGQFFSGLIDEVSYYNRALSGAEVQSIYNAGSAGKCVTPQCTSPPAGLVAWWPGQGNANDVVGTNNGTLLNGATFAPGEVGSAFSFDGANAVAQIADSPALSIAPGSALTVELWAYRTSTNSVGCLLGKRIGCGDNSGINYQMAYGGLDFGLCFGAGHGDQVLPGIDLALNTWTHLAGTFEGGTYKFYINGQVVGTATGMTLGPTNSAPLEIAGSGSCAHFGGLLDEVSIYNRALTQGEIAPIYNAGSAGKCVPPLPPVPPRTATASAVVTNGFFVWADITGAGYGYTNTPTVRIIGGGGSGAQAVAVISNGVVLAINILDAGFGYTSTPLVVIGPPFVPNPILGIAPMSFLSFSNLTLRGVYQLQQWAAWYWSNQPVSFTATNALYTMMVAGLAGSGDYRLALNPVPAQAFAAPDVTNGFIIGAIVTSGGSGYVTSPAVAIVGGGGTNATAVSHISSVVTSIIITDAGIGYTNTPTVRARATVSKKAAARAQRCGFTGLGPSCHAGSYMPYRYSLGYSSKNGWLNSRRLRRLLRKELEAASLRMMASAAAPTALETSSSTWRRNTIAPWTMLAKWRRWHADPSARPLMGAVFTAAFVFSGLPSSSRGAKSSRVCLNLRSWTI